MQKDTRTEPFADELSVNGKPRFIARAVFRPKLRHDDEAAPWKGQENGAKVPEEGLRALTRGGPFSHANGHMPFNGSESQINAPLDNESKSSKEIFRKEGNMLSSWTTSETDTDTRAGGSIRDRIAALSAAAGVTRLNVTPGREQSKITLTKSVTQPSEDKTRRGVKADLFADASKSSKNTENQQELSQISAKNAVAFDVGFQNTPKNRSPPRVLSRFKPSNLEGKDEALVSESQLVSSSEIGAVQDKSIAFALSFDDEPRSKRAKDEPVLLQSPFKAFKSRSNLRRQQKAKPCQPQGTQPTSTSKVSERGFLVSSPKDDSKPNRDVFAKSDKSADTSTNVKTAQKQYEISFAADKQFTEKAANGELPVETASGNVKSTQEDCKDKSDFKVPQLLKRNTFTLETVSNEGLPIVKVLNDLASKEESNQGTVLPSSDHVPKRSTFTLDSVSQSIETASSEGLPVSDVLNDLANKEEFKQSKLQSDVDTSSLPVSENSQKRSTFTLDSVSQEIDNAIRREGLMADGLQEAAKSEEENSLQNKTVAVDTETREDLPLEMKHESSEKRSTYTLDAVSSSLQSGAEEGLTATEVLCQLAKREELKSSNLSGVEDSLTQIDSVPKRGTFTLDTVSQSLEDAQSKGLPTVDVLDQLASKQESNLPVNTPPENNANSKPSPNRGTYTMDTVSHAIEEAVERGVPVSVTLNHLAQEETPLRRSPAHGYDDSSAGEVAQGTKTHLDPRPLSPDHRDEIEASFEDALEQLEDCLTFVSFPSASDRERRFTNRRQSSLDHERSSPERDRLSPDREQSCSDREQSCSDREQSSSRREQSQEKRGTYNLDDVANSVEDGVKDGVPVIVTLKGLSKTRTLPKDDVEKTQLSDKRRGTYTLDEVSLSLQTASQQGIPVVEALKNMTRADEPAGGTGESAQKRGTYTLDQVSKSLEHAEKTGIPVVEALESLSKGKPASPLRLKIPERSPENRGTYTLDEVSHTLEKAKQKGLPVVDALGQMTASKDVSFRQTPDAVHRRQEKLVNRKTYALASPLETIGEGTKLRLYDGSQRQMMSPLSLHIKTKEITASKANSNENKARGLGVVQKLDFLTSACELLLQANAKEISKDQQQTASLPENTRNNPTTDESVRRSHEIHPDFKSITDGSQTERRTYSLDSVSQSIDDAKAAGIPIVDALKTVTSVAKTGTTRRSNLKRLNSKSDSELINEGSEKQSSKRYTHSLEDMPRTLEDAKKAGIPVIQALDQLTNELAEFSRTALGGDIQTVSLDKDNRKRKRHSETPIGHLKPTREQSPNPSPHGSPYPPPIRKAYSLDDVAFAVQQAFQSGTSLNDFLDSFATEKPVEPVSSSRDVRPRSADSGFLSSLSDYDISSHSFESSRNRSNTFILDSSNEELDLAKIVGSQVKQDTIHAANTTQSPMVDQDENRRTFTLDYVSGSVERELSRGIPVIEALEKLSLNSAGLKTDHAKEIECKENEKNVFTEIPDKTLEKPSTSRKKKSPPKPKRQISKKSNSQQLNSDALVVEFFSSNGPQQPNMSKFQIVNKVEEVNVINNEANVANPEKDIKSTEPSRDPESAELKTDANTAPPRGRATWRPSGSVLDKIASLMDAADDCGMSPSDVLSQVSDLPCDAEGEIEETPDAVEDEKAVTSQMAYLRMQLEEKRRHIEAEKHRAQAEWEDQRRRLGQTAFWYVMGKAQGGQNVGEGTGPEVAHSDNPPVHDKPRNPVAEFPNQPSPPIAWSSPANSPQPASVSKPSPSSGSQFETREFRLSDYPPGDGLGTNQDTARPSSQPAVEVGSRPTPVPPRPSSHDPAASRYTAPVRKCWDVDVAQVRTPPPLVQPDTTSMSTDTKQENPPGGGAREIEVDIQTPNKRGLAMFIGEDASPAAQGLTPEQERKREKFMRLRQKKQEEDKTRKEAEMEKKRRKEEKQREKEMLQKMEEERLRHEEVERQKAEQELRMREAQATARVPDSYTTYRRPGPRQHVYDVDDDANSYFVPAPAQPSGFAEFSGPQCYVKPSGKSNRKIIVNAISHVCLSGTVNQDQKEKCLQAISESDGHHFMILFKDGLKFRGIYVHNLDNDQLFKIFGIGPRVITSKMIEGLYKYNSGGKEFTKIPSKTLSISVDGFAIQKSYWHTGKPVVQSKTSSNLKRPPRPPQR
ncbi:uncharacterized protein LOC144664608 isoform X1 [Oculina patagonica]